MTIYDCLFPTRGFPTLLVTYCRAVTQDFLIELSSSYEEELIRLIRYS